MCLSLPHPWFAFFFCPFSLVILFIPQADFGFFLEHRPCWRCLLFPGPWGSLAVVVLSESACGSGASYLFGAGIGTAAGLSVTIVVSYTVPSFIFYFRNMWSSSLATLIFFFPQKHLCSSPPVELFLWHHVCILQRWSEVYSFLLSPYFAFHP